MVTVHFHFHGLFILLICSSFLLKIISFSIARVGMSMLSVEDRVSSVFIFLLLFME